MLREMKGGGLKNDPGVGPGVLRRWFADEYFDLFVWTDSEGIRAFELCFDKPRDERAVAWKWDRGFSRARIDAGEDNPAKNNTPIWVKDEGELKLSELILRFEQSGGELDPKVYEFVRAKLASL